MADVIAIPIGAAANGPLLRPPVPVFEDCQQDWLAIVGEEIVHER